MDPPCQQVTAMNRSGDWGLCGADDLPLTRFVGRTSNWSPCGEFDLVGPSSRMHSMAIPVVTARLRSENDGSLRRLFRASLMIAHASQTTPAQIR